MEPLMALHYNLELPDVEKPMTSDAIQKLAVLLQQISHDSTDPKFQTAADMQDAKTEVVAKYGKMFSLGGVNDLKAEGFRSFLLFRNNHHWDSIHRQGGSMTEDMDLLRKAIRILVDESVPLKDRIEQLRPKNKDGLVKGMARAVITAILQVVYPDKYGVLNSTARAGMEAVGLWPDFPRGLSFAERYAKVNAILLHTAAQLGTDLWTLDILWWIMPSNGGDPTPPVEPPPADVLFGLEKYLHEFLVDNWQQTTLAADWDLLEEDGEIVGTHYKTQDVGEIDLLAKHKKQKRWLVVELKRNQSSDATVGQLLRYMGWVRKKLSEPGDKVEGLIICGEPDLKLQYALDGQPNIDCMTYLVNFTLNPVPALE